jgi:hypothetical protein
MVPIQKAPRRFCSSSRVCSSIVCLPDKLLAQHYRSPQMCSSWPGTFGRVNCLSRLSHPVDNSTETNQVAQHTEILHTDMDRNKIYFPNRWYPREHHILCMVRDRLDWRSPDCTSRWLIQPHY